MWTPRNGQPLLILLSVPLWRRNRCLAVAARLQGAVPGAHRGDWGWAPGGSPARALPAWVRGPLAAPPAPAPHWRSRTPPSGRGAHVQGGGPRVRAPTLTAPNDPCMHREPRHHPLGAPARGPSLQALQQGLAFLGALAQHLQAGRNLLDGGEATKTL